jgi:CBS domain-containing protein
MTDQTTSPASPALPRVADVMHHGIVSCTRTTNAREIAQLMISHGVHCVAVLSPSPEPGHPPLIWGIVTDLNLLGALADNNSQANAETLAGGQVIRVRPSQTINEAADVMAASSAHHLVVIDPDNHQPIGIISTSDIAPLLAARKPNRC